MKICRKSTYGVVNLNELTSNAPSEKIQRCNKIFLDMKLGTMSVYLLCSIFIGGSCLSSVASRLLKNRLCSIGISNIAGEEEGFWLGGSECVDFSLSTGGIPGIGNNPIYVVQLQN